MVLTHCAMRSVKAYIYSQTEPVKTTLLKERRMLRMVLKVYKINGDMD